MSTPTERVREYLRQFDRLRDTGGVVHQVATDPDAPEGIALTSADLHAILEQAGQAATVPLIDTRDGAPITRKDPDVIGYAVAARDGFLVAESYPSDDKEAAHRLRDEWTRDIPKGLDWDYRVVGIIELPAEEA